MTTAFSVIIPTFDRAEALRRALESLVEQTYKDFEVLVCDDGSTDQTKEVAEEFREYLNLKYLGLEHWGGPARPRNRGIAEASGEWICLLDADDWWLPNKLDAVSERLAGADVIYHPLRVSPSRIGRLIGWDVGAPVFQSLMLHGNGIPNSSVCVRSEVVAKCGDYSERRDLIAVEDLELMLRIATITDRFAFIPEPLGCYFVGGGDSIGAPSLKFLDALRAVSKVHENNLSTPGERRAHSGMLHYQAGRTLLGLGEHRAALREFLACMKLARWSTRLKALFFSLKSLIRL